MRCEWTGERAAREGNAMRLEQEASEDAEDAGDDEDDEELVRTLGLTLPLWLVVVGFGRTVHGRVLVLTEITRLCTRL